MARVRRATPGACSALALALAACGGDSPTGKEHGGPPVPVVEVVRVAPQPLEDEADLLGQLEAEESVLVRSEVPGVIEAIAFEEGDRVAQGQVLFRLRDQEQRARLHEAQAELRLAEDTHQRTQGLAQRQVVAAAQLERAAAEREVARARVEVAQAALDRTEIRAPFDGLAGARLVSPGARIEPDRDLVKVEAIQNLELVFTLPELALPLARVGVPLELSVAPYPGELFPGVVSFVAPSLNPQNRRLLVKARVPNPDLRLRPGLFAKVQARIDRREDALVLPEDAIVYGSEGSFVWRIDAEGVAAPVPVELGLRQAGRVEVTAGLHPGDVVVVAGTNKLSPGVRVEAVPAPEGAAPAAPAQAAPKPGGAGPRPPESAG